MLLKLHALINSLNGLSSDRSLVVINLLYFYIKICVKDSIEFISVLMKQLFQPNQIVICTLIYSYGTH